MLIKLLYCLEARISPNNLQISLPETLLTPTDASGKISQVYGHYRNSCLSTKEKNLPFQHLVSITKKITS